MNIQILPNFQVNMQTSDCNFLVFVVLNDEKDGRYQDFLLDREGCRCCRNTHDFLNLDDSCWFFTSSTSCGVSCFPSQSSSITASSLFRSTNFPLFLISYSAISIARFPMLRAFQISNETTETLATGGNRSNTSLCSKRFEKISAICLVYGGKCIGFGLSSHFIWRWDRERSMTFNYLESGSDGHSKIRYKTLCFLLTSWSISSRTSIIIWCFFHKVIPKGRHRILLCGSMTWIYTQFRVNFLIDVSNWADGGIIYINSLHFWLKLRGVDLLCDGC